MLGAHEAVLGVIVIAAQRTKRASCGQGVDLGIGEQPPCAVFHVLGAFGTEVIASDKQAGDYR